MVQPFDYTTAIANPGAAFQQSYAQGLQIRAVQEAQAAARAAAQKKAADEAELRAGMIATSNANTPLEFLEVRKKYPQFASVLSKEFTALDEVRQNATYDAGQRAFALLSSGPDGQAKAVESLLADADRFKNSKMPDMEQKARGLAEIVKVSPDARKAIGMTMAAINPDRWEKFGKAQESIGKAEKVEQETAAIAEQRPFDLRAATADAIVKEVEAKFKPQTLLAELGLKGAQTQSAQASAASSMASAAASRATAARATAEAGQMRAGIIPAEKRPEAEGKFRKEYSDQTKGYQDVKAAYSRILASDQTAAGDMSRIFNYMKMLDPGSVVREGEFANAQNAAGVPDRVLNAYNNVLSGERLNPEQRKQFENQAKKLYTQARTQEATVRKGIERIATGYGLSPANIFYEATESEPTAPTVAPTRSGGMPAQGATGGFRVVERRAQ